MSDRPVNQPKRVQRLNRAVRQAVEVLEGRTLLSVTIPALADARVERSTEDLAAVTYNFGLDPELRVDVDAAHGAESFVTFDLTDAGGVGSATLVLRGEKVGEGDDPTRVGAFAVPTIDWVEGNGTAAAPDADNDPAGELTWATRPDTTGAAIDVAFVARRGDYYLNVTNYVRARKAAGATAVSFALRNVGGAVAPATFDSREVDGDADTAGPLLVVEPNANGPVAAFTAPNLTAAATAQTVTVTYTDPDGVDLETIDENDITVTAPGRDPATVTAADVTGSTPTSATVVYTVTGPGGSWDEADDALWVSVLQTGEVTDARGNTAAGGPDGFFVTIDDDSPGSTDQADPTAKVTAGDVSTAGNTAGSFTVTYADDNAINASTIDVGDVVVSRPGSPNLRVTGVTVEPNVNAKSVVATYTFNALGGTWSESDNGTYEVQVVAGAVADVAGKLTPAVSGTFDVNVPATVPPIPDTTAPTAEVASAPPIVAPDVLTQNVQVTYADDAGVDVGSVDVNDITVTLGGTHLEVVAVSANPPADGKVITAIYTVAAPDGEAGFVLADNGVYAVAVQAGAVVDTAGNPAAAAAGSFEVALPPPKPAVDPTFATGVVAAVAGEGSVVQPDGRFLVAGHTGDTAAGTGQGVLQRFNPDGSPDLSFGDNGQVVTASGVDAYYAVTVAADGRILVAGASGGDFAVTRFKSNGSVDKSFGTGGRAVADFGGTDVAYAVAFAADGTVAVGGSSTTATGSAFAVVRLDDKGKALAGFGDAGRAQALGGTGGRAVAALAVQGDGKVVAAGGSAGKVNVVRFNADGQLDGGYGSAGVAVVNAVIVETGLDTPDYTIGLVLQSGDRAVVANRSAGGDFAVARLTAAGQLDATFGSAGVRTVDFSGGDDDADTLLAQGTGELYVVGTTTTANGTSTAVAALTADGALDTDYNAGGKVVVDTAADSGRALHSGDLVRRAFASVAPDGRVVVGSSNQGNGGLAPQSGIRRLNATGSGLVGEFGLVAGKNRSLKFADADGTVATLSLKGGGTAQVFFNGTYFDVVVTGATDRSSLKLKAKGGDKRINLRNLRTDGPMKAIQMAQADLSDTLAVDGALADLRLRTVTGTVAIAGSAGKISLAGDLDGGQILVGADLGADAARGGLATNLDVFRSATLKSISIKGRANAALVTAGVDPRNNVFLDSDDQVLGGASSVISSISVRGGTDGSTRFVSGAFGKAKLPARAAFGQDIHLQTV